MQTDSKTPTLIKRVEALKKFNAWETKHLSFMNPQAALAGIVMLYELMPKESRRRPVNPNGIKAMHLAFSRLKSKPA
jgi:hypothetical protein